MLPKDRQPSSPGEILKFYLDESELSQVEFAEHLGWTTTRLNQIIKNKRAITPETALCLADAFGTSPELWLNIQRGWDLYHARKAHKPRNRVAVAC